jgi:predicted ATPase
MFMNMETSPSVEPFLARVKIRNYKSIGRCDVTLARMSVFIGRNGSGKSNFLDALQFVVDGLVTSLEHAIKARGGIQAVRRKSTGHPSNFAIELKLNLPGMQVANYAFEVAARKEGGFSVKREALRVINGAGNVVAHYSVLDGDLKSSYPENLPKPVSDRLFLVVASGISQFRPAYDTLCSMGFYNFNPEAMRELQSPDAGELLHHDGDNIASVIGRMNDAEKERAESYLSKIAPGVDGVERSTLGPRETLEFRQSVEGAEHPWRFLAASMSDGTLRALGILMAASQSLRYSGGAQLVGIEEPETALHPAAARALMDALQEATTHTQVLITTHSSELLDAMEFEPGSLFVVEAIKGETFISHIDPASRKIIEQHLSTPGEMLRMDQLQQDRQDLQRQASATLFDFVAEAT